MDLINVNVKNADYDFAGCPDNIFVYAQGPFPTTILPTSSKYGVFAKSPLTGMFGMAISSGSVTGK